MLALIPFTFGNRRPDVWGNVHSRWDDRGRIVYRNAVPGYVGRHRSPRQPFPIRWAARWEGVDV